MLKTLFQRKNIITSQEALIRLSDQFLKLLKHPRRLKVYGFGDRIALVPEKMDLEFGKLSDIVRVNRQCVKLQHDILKEYDMKVGDQVSVTFHETCVPRIELKKM